MPKPASLNDLKCAINSDGCHEFLQIIGRKNALKTWSSLLEGVASSEVPELCDGLRKKMESALELCTGVAGDLHNGNDGSTASPVLGTPSKLATLDTAGHTIASVANIATALALETRSDVSDSLHALAVTMHDNCILTLGDNILGVAQSAVAGLCCSWWQHKLPGREQLVSQTLIFLLVQGLQSRKQVDIKLLFTMREMLTVFDFEESSINDTKCMLLQAFICPPFLQSTHGRKFLAFLLTLDAQLVREICAIMRHQIPGGKLWMLEAFGEIILKGWREAEGGVKLEVERTCVQGLARAALSVASSSVAANLRAVLNQIHTHKLEADVTSMLVRLYEPILFRALSAANPVVRLNALMLLLDAFPLMDSESSTEEDVTALMVQQFTAVSDALADTVVSIRCAAALGVCRWLSLYWEMIPPATAAAYLCRLAGELAFDKSSPAVRVAALNGLGQLVDNRLAQPVLKGLLPRLGSLIADKNIKVRQALAELLLAASSCRELSVQDVVPLDIMVELMGRDDPTVVAIIQQLVLPCYFPTPEEGVAHVPALLKRNPDAGAAFCRWLAAGPSGGGDGIPQVCIALEHVVDLASALMQHLLAARESFEEDNGVADTRPAKRPATGKGRARAGAKTQPAGRKKRKGAGKPEEGQTVLPNNLSVEDWEAMLRGLKELCQGLQLRLQQLDEDGVSATLDSILPAACLVQLLVSCKSHTARACVWQLAALFPSHPAASELTQSCLELLESERGLCCMLTGMEEDDEGQVEEMEAMLLCLCSNRQAASCLMVALNCSLKDEDPVVTEYPEVVCNSDELCSVCGGDDSDGVLLLCDGCDAGWHMGCLTPAVDEVPDGVWFCPCCIQHIGRLGMSQVDAARCLQVMIDMPLLRNKLLDEPYFLELLNPLAHATDAQLETCLTRLHQDTSDGEQRSAPPTPATSVHAATPKPNRRGRARKHPQSDHTDGMDAAQEDAGTFNTIPGCTTTKKKKTAAEKEDTPAALQLLLRFLMHIILDTAAKAAKRPSKGKKAAEAEQGPTNNTSQWLSILREALVGCADMAGHLHARLETLEEQEDSSLPKGMQETFTMLMEALALCADAMQLRLGFAGGRNDSRDMLKAFHALVVQCLKTLGTKLAHSHHCLEDCMLVHLKACSQLLQSLVLGARVLGNDQGRAERRAAVQLEPLLRDDPPDADYGRDICEVAKEMMAAAAADKTHTLVELMKHFSRPVVLSLLKPGIEVSSDWLHPVASAVAPAVPGSSNEDQEASFSPQLHGSTPAGPSGQESPPPPGVLHQQEGLPALAQMLVDTSSTLQVVDSLQRRLVELAQTCWPAAEWEALVGALQMLKCLNTAGGPSVEGRDGPRPHSTLQQLLSAVASTLASDAGPVPSAWRPPLQALVASLG